MNGIRMIAALIGTALLSCALPAAAEPSPGSDVPDVFTLAMRLEGRWQAKASLTMVGRTTSFLYALSFRKAAAGQALYLEESGEIPGVGSLQGASLVGFDPVEGKLHWFTVDNLGTAHDHIGELVGKDHLRLVHVSQREGKTFREVTDFVWLAPDRIQARLQATLDEVVVEVLEGTLTRVKGQSP